MRRFFLIRFPAPIILEVSHEMPYQKATRPPNAVPDEMVWRALGLSRATFYRRLKDGSLSAPIERSGTTRRWWTPADIEIARQEMAAPQTGKEGARP